jgi:hypothetical protein
MPLSLVPTPTLVCDGVTTLMLPIDSSRCSCTGMKVWVSVSTPVGVAVVVEAGVAVTILSVLETASGRLEAAVSVVVVAGGGGAGDEVDVVSVVVSWSGPEAASTLSCDDGGADLCPTISGGIATNDMHLLLLLLLFVSFVYY